jgi:hypothetical protein
LIDGEVNYLNSDIAIEHSYEVNSCTARKQALLNLRDKITSEFCGDDRFTIAVIPVGEDDETP